MADETIYRCINAACGRPTPRPVNFCPWCGTAQARAAGVRDAAAAPASAAATAAAAGASAAAALSGWSDAPPDLTPPPRQGAAVPPAPAKPAAAPSASAFGRSGKEAPAQGATGQAPPRPDLPRQEVPRPQLAAHPPQRRPIRLRWWLLALVLLWGVWYVVKPSARKIERRIDAAIALARECKASDAQTELIALRKSRAKPEQLQRLQRALNDEAAKCTKRRQRSKAWNEASAAVGSALAASGWDRARSRLQAFTKRWGEDVDTRAMKDRIEAARREASHPLAVPRGALGSSGRGSTGSGGGKAGREGKNQ